MTWVLTDGLDEVCQEDAIAQVLLQVGDEFATAGLVQVVVGPVRVHLHTTNKHYNNKAW